MPQSFFDTPEAAPKGRSPIILENERLKAKNRALIVGLSLTYIALAVAGAIWAFSL